MADTLAFWYSNHLIVFEPECLPGNRFRARAVVVPRKSAGPSGETVLDIERAPFDELRDAAEFALIQAMQWIDRNDVAAEASRPVPLRRRRRSLTG